MTINIRNILVVPILFCLLAVVSCNDRYDEHYSEDTTGKSELNLYDYLKSREDLSAFVQLVETAGYADTLKNVEAFTVFAPNNDALSSLPAMSVEETRLFVGSHIANFTQSGPATFLTFNKKYLTLSIGSDGFYFDQNKITEPNIRTQNGLVHVMNNYVPYRINMWEFIQQTEGIDSLRDYINSLTYLEFDTEASYDENDIFIDSVFVERNDVLELLGAINEEAYRYTSIIPANAAWIETYDKILPYYRSGTRANPNSSLITNDPKLQVSRTKWNLIKDMLFLNEIDVPTGLDSLVSTYGTVYKNPDYLFAGASKEELSNGYAYVTNQMQNKQEDAWLSVLRVEAEQNRYSLRTTENCDLETRSTFGTNFPASANYYARFSNLPTNLNTKVSAKFPIPGTLANVKYNIYCVFIPTSAINAETQVPYAVNFALSYYDNNGIFQTDRTIGTSKSVTQANEVTKLLVAQNYTFSFCDILDLSDPTNTINVFLKVENAATRSELLAGTYSRNIAIDCILLEPVIE